MEFMSRVRNNGTNMKVLDGTLFVCNVASSMFIHSLLAWDMMKVHPNGYLLVNLKD